MITIVDDYLLLLGSLGAIVWGFIRYLLAGRVVANDGNKSRLTAAWAVGSAVVLVTGAAVMLAVAQLGTENVIPDILAWVGAAVFVALALFVPRPGYRPDLATLDKAILLVLAVLLLAGSLYDNLTG